MFWHRQRGGIIRGWHGKYDSKLFKTSPVKGGRRRLRDRMAQFPCSTVTGELKRYPAPIKRNTLPKGAEKGAESETRLSLLAFPSDTDVSGNSC